MWNSRSTERGLALLATLAAAPLAPRPVWAQGFGGDAFSSQGPNCYSLKLKEATGVVSLKHTYHFVGTCNDGSRSFPAEAYVWWDRGSYALNEDFQIIGTYVNQAGKAYSGHVRSWFRCNDDPTVVPGAACNPVGHINQTGAKFLSKPYGERRPITKGKTTLTEAKALSVQTAAAGPPAAAGPHADIAVEAESLLASSLATHGHIARQDMRPFGSGWSRDEQLFWSVAQPGAQLRLTFTTAAAGRYQVFLRFTRAPDYAFVRASFDGAPPVAFDGYAPAVSHDRAFLGMFDLAPGLRELLVEVVMKDGKSAGLNVGLDRIELEPVVGRNRPGSAP
jgi:hypothetical protein